MSGTALDHRLVRGYLSELDAAMRGLQAAQARELREQIIAHLDDALGPGASDQEVAATLSRLGSPADLAAEAAVAGGSPAPRSARSDRRARWRLAAVIAVLVVIAATLGALRISNEAGSYAAASRDQHLARLDAAVVMLAQDLEDERDLSAAYADRQQKVSLPLTLVRARAATDAADTSMRADAAGVGAGYPPVVVHALAGLLAGLSHLRAVRAALSSSDEPPSLLIRLYTSIALGPAHTFAAAVGDAAGDARLQNTATTLAALLRVENDQSVQRAILYATLSARPPVLLASDLSSLRQTADEEISDLSAFDSSGGLAGQRLFAGTVPGTAEDLATSQELLAESYAATRPPAPLTENTGFDAVRWYREMTTTIADTRKVAGHLVGQVSGRADALKSNAITNLLLTSMVTLLLLLVLLTSAVLGRPLRR